MKSKSDGRKEEAIERLRKWLKPGDRVYTILRHCSRSGMSRVIDVVKPYVDKEGEIQMLGLGYNIADALELPHVDKKDGVRVGGCGMDMGFHLIHELGHVLWPDGFKTWPGYSRNGPLEFDPDGGYALRQSWL